MIEDVIDTLRSTTPAVNQEFVRKTQSDKSTYRRVSYSQILYANHVFSGYAFLLPMFKNFA